MNVCHPLGLRGDNKRFTRIQILVEARGLEPLTLGSRGCQFRFLFEPGEPVDIRLRGDNMGLAQNRTAQKKEPRSKPGQFSLLDQYSGKVVRFISRFCKGRLPRSGEAVSGGPDTPCLHSRQ